MEENYNLAKKNKRLRKKCNNFQNFLLQLKNERYFTVDQFNELKLKAEAIDLTNRLIAKSKCKGYRPK